MPVALHLEPLGGCSVSDLHSETKIRLLAMCTGEHSAVFEAGGSYKEELK